MKTLFNSANRTPHIMMAQKLSRLVQYLGTYSSQRDISDDSNMIDSAFGVVTRILPVTRFDGIAEMERIANDIEETKVIGPSNVWNEMFGIFYELGLNAVQHSQSAAGCYVVSEYTTVMPNGIVYAVGVADNGIGIPASLRRNPNYAHITSDADCIARATELQVTGTGELQRGLGLDHIMRVVKKLRGNFALISGMGYLNVVNGLMDNKDNVNSTDHIQGTVAVVTLSV